MPNGDSAAALKFGWAGDLYGYSKNNQLLEITRFGRASKVIEIRANSNTLLVSRMCG